MRALNIYVIACFFLCAVQVSFAKSGFILTAPKVIDAGSTEYFTLTVFDAPSEAQVTLSLLHGHTGRVLAKSEVNVVNNYNVWIEMVVPPLSADADGKLKIEGKNGFPINAEKAVKIRHNSVVTFIETDKPIYKPGQIVRLRVLPLDSQLKPLGNDTVGDVWIEDPSNIRIAQWNQVKFTGGMSQMELPLSEEPPLGIWTISATINEVTVEQKFKVEKYVLPKFEVKIKPPDNVMADAETISTEICAFYTYGKKVDGVFKAKITYERFRWEKKMRIPCVEYHGQISGCQEFVVNTTDIVMHHPEFGLHRKIIISAEVIENGTEIMRNNSVNVEIIHKRLLLNFMGSETATGKFNYGYFKPGISFNGKIKAEELDGTPAASKKIQMCVYFHHFIAEEKTRKVCKLFTSNRNGIISFSIAPAPTSVCKIILEAEAQDYVTLHYRRDMWPKKISQPKTNMELAPWFSPSGSYLQIEPILGELECEKLKRVKVRYSAEKGIAINFFHQVLSRGRIVQQGSHQRIFYISEEENHDFYWDSTKLNRSDTSDPSLKPEQYQNTTELPDIGEFSLSLDPRATMAPVARLLVFYVTEKGEVVADSQMFRIEKCLLNKVGLHFRHEQQYPSTDASVLLSASPSSVCGITLMDKSIRLLENDSQFSKKKLFEFMETYDVGKYHEPRQVADDYCYREDVRSAGSGLLCCSSRDDFPLDYFHCFEFTKYVDSMMAFEEAGMVVISDLELETRPCSRATPIPISLEGRIALSSRNFDDMQPYTPYSMPKIGPPPSPTLKKPSPKPKPPPKSIEEIRSYFPETWLWEMHTVGASGEMALTKKLPDTITEWTGGAICVHPKTGLGISEPSSITAFQPFFLSFHLPYSVIRKEVLPVVVSVFNYLTECLPIKLSLEQSEDYKMLSESRSHKLCVCGGDTASNSFMIRPLTIGLLNVTVYAYSLEDDDDEVCGNEVTARLSARDAATRSLLVEAEGFPKEETFNYYVCPENTNGSFATEVDLLLPENVIDGSARAYMSVSGDLMGPALNGLGSLVKMPAGCGEQNMILFVPNILVLDYLTAVGKITEAVKEKCHNNMQKGYQRELKYRHSDGSYSAFGKRDEYGSLWLTAFVLKSFGQARRFITIDEHDLRLSTAWILEKQFENGCFEPIGYVHQKSMKGGLSVGEQSLAPLTAYVLISLLESGAETRNHSAVRNALKCLEAETFPSSYGLALFAYATALAGETIASQKYLKQLEESAVKRDSHTYWNSSESKSVNIEIAGYYILAQLTHDSQNTIGNSQPVVRWITKQRNSNGGFVSTQDTVVALQALAAFAALQSDKQVDLRLVIENDEIVRGFKVDESNKLVTQSVKIPALPTVVDLQAVGDGCALVQFNMRYNVKRVSGSEAFDLKINVLSLGSSNCNLPKIGICMRYKVPDETTNMVVLTVKMVSGYVPDQWSLHKLKECKSCSVQLKRHEVDGNQVNLYFSKLTNEEQCFEFFIKSEIEVEDVQPATVHLYDYYQPELEVTKDYTIPSSCSPPTRLSPPMINTDYDDYYDTNFSFSSEVTESPDALKQTHNDGYTTEVSSSTQRITTTATETQFENDTDVEGLPDYANEIIVSNNLSSIDNFVDVSHDLDFPDGIEGNAIVSDLPFVEPTTEAFVENTNNKDCPMCKEDFPENFTDIYCNSAFVLRVLVPDWNNGMVFILKDVSNHVPRPKAVRKFAKLTHDERCMCPQLHARNSTLLILGSPITLWNSEKEKHELQLTSSVYIIPSPNSTQPSRVRKAKFQCTIDP